MGKKDFAFLFYVNDWAGGTMGFNRLQRAGYFDLLLYQFHNTCFSSDEVANILGSDFDAIWPAIKHKFALNEQKKFYNVRMAEVMKDRAIFCESRRNNRLGKTKKTKKLKKNIRKTSVKHKENENENENSSVISLKGQVAENAQKHPLIEFISQNCPNVQQLKLPLTEAQANMILQHYPEKDIQDVLLSMENYKELQKKYNSVYLTANNWLKMRKQNSKEKNDPDDAIKKI